jgi:hypothetical protein
LIDELDAGTVKVPGPPLELVEEPLELLGLLLALEDELLGVLGLVAALLLVLVLALVAELDGAVGEPPPLPATELLGLVGWLPELACGVVEDEHA